MLFLYKQPRMQIGPSKRRKNESFPKKSLPVAAGTLNFFSLSATNKKDFESAKKTNHTYPHADDSTSKDAYWFYELHKGTVLNTRCPYSGTCGSLDTTNATKEQDKRTKRQKLHGKNAFNILQP